MKKLPILLVALLAPLASACLTTRAHTPAERPPLEVPPVPPRVVEPVTASEPTQPEPVGDLPPPPATTARPRPPVRDPNTNASRDAKPEPKPEAAPPVEAAPATPPPAPALPPLRTPGTADEAQAEKQIREIIDRAGGLLNKVDYRRLSQNSRKAYDDAKLFMQGAEDGIKASNFELARELAGKAEKLAKELQGR